MERKLIPLESSVLTFSNRAPANPPRYDTHLGLFTEAATTNTAAFRTRKRLSHVTALYHLQVRYASRSLD